MCAICSSNGRVDPLPAPFLDHISCPTSFHHRNYARAWLYPAADPLKPKLWQTFDPAHRWWASAVGCDCARWAVGHDGIVSWIRCRSGDPASAACPQLRHCNGHCEAWNGSLDAAAAAGVAHEDEDDVHLGRHRHW